MDSNALYVGQIPLSVSSNGAGGARRFCTPKIRLASSLVIYVLVFCIAVDIKRTMVIDSSGVLFSSDKVLFERESGVMGSDAKRDIKSEGDAGDIESAFAGRGLFRG